MPRGYSVREATNEHEVYSALAAATKGYGRLTRFASHVGITRQYIEGMLYGTRRISVEVAGYLGFELRWVRKQK